MQKIGEYKMQIGDSVITSRGLFTVLIEHFEPVDGLEDPWLTLHGVVLDGMDCRVVFKRR